MKGTENGMYDRTCCSADCPNTDGRIIGVLCEFWYPYGSKKRCQALLDKLIETNNSVAEVHQEYLEKNKEKRSRWKKNL